MKHYLIDTKGNHIVMGTDEFNAHQLLNESSNDKEIFKFDVDWYLAHGYSVFEKAKKEIESQ